MVERRGYITMAKWSDVKHDLTALDEYETKELALMAKFLNKIVERRHALDLTQQELGERAGFKQTYIARIERGTTLPRLDTLIRLALALDLELALIPKEFTDHREEAATAAVVKHAV